MDLEFQELQIALPVEALEFVQFVMGQAHNHVVVVVALDLNQQLVLDVVGMDIHLQTGMTVLLVVAMVRFLVRLPVPVVVVQAEAM